MKLPDQRALVRLVRDALDNIAADLGPSGWERKIGDSISERLVKLDPRIECLYGKVSEGRPKDDQEWLLDFVAGIWEPNERGVDRFLMQAVIIGESEASVDFDRDFDKLLVADSIVCFFAFPDVKCPRRPEGLLEFYYKISESRRHQVASRGTQPAPAFILARHSS